MKGKQAILTWGVLCCLLLIATMALADEKEAAWGKLSGFAFGDYYWIASNHDGSLEDKNGIWLRRVYFTYDKKWMDELETRLRLEMNSSGNFRTSTTLVPFLKDAYVKWQPGLHGVIFGLSPTPTFDLVEEAWGYRPLEKTPQDLHGFGGARDLAFALKGYFDQEKRWGYHAMFGNGSGTGAEINSEKKFYLALSWRPIKELLLQIYGDWEAPWNQDAQIFTYQEFAAVKGAWGRAGILYTYQIRDRGPSPSLEDLELDLASLYAVKNLTDRVALVGRVDRMFDANPGGGAISYVPFEANSRSTFFLLGVDYELLKNLNILPNLEAIIYDEGGPAANQPESDIIPRLTVFYKF